VMLRVGFIHLAIARKIEAFRRFEDNSQLRQLASDAETDAQITVLVLRAWAGKFPWMKKQVQAYEAVLKSGKHPQLKDIKVAWFVFGFLTR
jgi:hypothetical protein